MQEVVDRELYMASWAQADKGCLWVYDLKNHWINGKRVSWLHFSMLMHRLDRFFTLRVHGFGSSICSSVSKDGFIVRDIDKEHAWFVHFKLNVDNGIDYVNKKINEMQIPIDWDCKSCNHRNKETCENA